MLIHVTVLPQSTLALSSQETRAVQLRMALAKLEPGPATRIAVKLSNTREVTGYLDHVGDQSFFVTDPNTGVSTQVAYNNVTRVSASLSTGAKVGLVAVAVVVLFFVSVWASVGRH